MQFERFSVKKVLDLGCGTGRHLVNLAEKNFDVVGIDNSPVAIDLARKWLATKDLKGEAFIADMHDEITFIDKSSFDAVLAIQSVQYTEKEKIKETIKEINRILKTGGLLYLVVPTIESKIDDLNVEQLFFTKESTLELLSDKFRILDIREDKQKFISIIAQEK
jgi:ubiquinone/menaquinone biosynthesis C-methylase UbiE